MRSGLRPAVCRCSGSLSGGRGSGAESATYASGMSKSTHRAQTRSNRCLGRSGSPSRRTVESRVCRCASVLRSRRSCSSQVIRRRIAVTMSLASLSRAVAICSRSRNVVLGRCRCWSMISVNESALQQDSQHRHQALSRYSTIRSDGDAH